MPLDALLQLGVLLLAVVTAFAISSAVGVLVARLWEAPRPLRGAPVRPRPRPSRPDPAPGTAADLPSATILPR